MRCTCAMACSVGMTRAMSVTPESLLVVAPAGYNLKAATPASLAFSTSSGGVLSVRYSVISGWNVLPSGTAARMRCLYCTALAPDEGQLG